MVLPWFGLTGGFHAVKANLRRYSKQGRLHLYWNVVSLPLKPSDWEPYAQDRAPTPNFESIKATVEREFSELADKDLNRTAVLEFVLSRAPEGLWQPELLAVCASLGFDCSSGTIHSVVGDLAREKFKRVRGRVLFTGCHQPGLKMEAIRQALLPHAEELRLRDIPSVLFRIATCFPEGVTRKEVYAGMACLGLVRKHTSITHAVCRFVRAGKLNIQNDKITVPALRPPLPAPDPISSCPVAQSA